MQTKNNLNRLEVKAVLPLLNNRSLRKLCEDDISYEFVRETKEFLSNIN